MEFVQQIRRSLRNARTVELPSDPNSAAYVLMPMIIGNQHRSVAELLANSSLDVNFPFGRAQRNFLQIAANCGSYECLCLLLKRGANVHYQDISGCTALHLAARNGQKKCMTKLLEHKADVNIRNNEGLTTLHWLAVNGRTELLHDLLPYVLCVDVDDSQGQTALHVACQNGHKTTVICLLDNGADVNRRNYSGASPLAFACKHGQRDTVQILLSRNAKFVADSRGVTPLELCVQGGYSETCEVLLNHNHRLYPLLLSLVPRADVKESMVLKILTYLVQLGDSQQNRILSGLAEMFTHAGLKLLSISSHFELQAVSFNRCATIFCRLYRFLHPFPSIVHCGSQSLAKTSALVKPIEVLWTSLEEWMILLHLEMGQSERDGGGGSRDLLVRPNTCRKCGSVFPVRDLKLMGREVSEAHFIARGEDFVSEDGSPGGEAFTEENIVPEAIYAPDMPNGSYFNGTGEDVQPDKCNLSEPDFADHLPETDEGDGGFALRDLFAGSTCGHCASCESGNGAVLDTEVEELAFGESFREVAEEKTRGGASEDVTGRDDIFDKTGSRLCAVIKAFYMYCECRTPEKITSPRFIEFVCRHDAVLKHLVARNPSIIFDYFAFLLDCPELMSRFLHIVHQQPFVTRKNWFYEHLRPPDEQQDLVHSAQSDLALRVRRGRYNQ